MKLFVKAEGDFRGGDPEELRMKKQEKMQAEKEDAGGFISEDQGEDAGEAPDPADVEEENMKEQEKKEAAGKSIGFGSSQVSPVETNSDYVPRDKNNEPIHPLEFRGHAQPWIDVGPPRCGENQWKPWSEVIGAKVPMIGNPAMHLRQYGDLKERAKEQAIMAKAQDDSDSEPMGGARQLLEQIPQMNEDQLRQFAKRIWGDDYEFDEWANEEYMREDLIGTVMDKIEAQSSQHVDEMRDAAPRDLDW